MRAGSVQSRLHRFHRAAVLLAEASRSGGGPDTLVGLAEMLRRKSRLAEARAAAEAALALDPGSEPARRSLAEIARMTEP